MLFRFCSNISLLYLLWSQAEEEESHQQGPCQSRDALGRQQRPFFSNFIVRAGQPFVIVIIRQTLKHEQPRKLSSSEDFKLFSKAIYAGNSKCVSSNEHSQMYAKAWTKLSEKKMSNHCIRKIMSLTSLRLLS